MKKRAMKKYIPRDSLHCYVITGIELNGNGLPKLKCTYCKNFYKGDFVNDAIIGADGTEHPVRYRKHMCRYVGEELIYNDSKQCGVGY